MNAEAVRRPTAGAVRFACSVLRSFAGDDPCGPVQLEVSQSQLAAQFGLSAGTVSRHLRELGPVVLSRVPLVIDVDALALAAPHARVLLGPTRPALRLVSPDPSPDTVTTPPPPVRGDRLDDLVDRLADVLVDRVLAAVEARIAVRLDPHASVATHRDEAAASAVGRGSSRLVAEVVSEQISVQLRTTAARPRSVVARRRGGRDPVADGAVREALVPLIEWCRRNGRPTAIDAAGVLLLAELPADHLQAGVRNLMLLSATPGRSDRPVRNPLGLLVSAARRYLYEDDKGFFTPPPEPSAAGPVPVIVTDEPLLHRLGAAAARPDITQEVRT